MQRLESIQQWLNQVLKTSDYEMHYLAGDASFRRYARIQLNQQRFMLMDAPPDKEDCTAFVQIDVFLSQHGVRVPHIIAQNSSEGLLLLEDFGDEVLSKLLSVDTVDAYYLQSFKQLIHLQSIDGRACLPMYSAEKLQSELALFNEWLLPSLAVVPTAEEQAMIQQSFDVLVQNAVQQPQVIVHRDYHSRNLMVLDATTELGIIDFQDAVIGADTYDLISIIRDAYVHWSEAHVERWLQQFYDLLPESAKVQREFSLFKQQADLMAIQRHIKILGIFVRLFERDGKAGYLKDLPLVMWYVRTLGQRYAVLTPFMQFLEQRVVPAFQVKYGNYQNPYEV